MNDSPTARRQIGNLCKEKIAEAKTNTDPWRRRGDQLMRYGFADNYDFEYINISPDSYFKAKYAKTAEAFQQLGPRLAPLAEVTRLLRPRYDDPAVMARTAARMAYLNYTPTVNRYINQRRQVVNDGLGYGTGVMWTGRDSRTGLITSIWDPVGRNLRDPAARMPEDERCRFRKRIRPRQDVMRDYPEAAAEIEKIQEYSPVDDDKNEWLQGGAPPAKGNICYWECWFNRGIYSYEGGSEILSQALNSAGVGRLSKEQMRDLTLNSKDQPMVYLVTEDGLMFHSFEWPIPYNLLTRDGWPNTFFDLYTGTDPLHPVSPLAPGLGIQKAMNHLLTLTMGRARFSLRTGFIIKKANGKGLSKDDVFRCLDGNDIDNFEIDFGRVTDQKTSVKDYIETLDWGMEWLPSVINLLNTFERIYERLTPLSEFLSTGAGQVQDRSAEATRVRDRNQMARMEDLGDMIRDADTMVARKEAFAASYLLGEEDVSKVIPQEAQNWGFLAEPEAKDPNYWMQQIPQEITLGDPMMAQEIIAAQMQNAYTLDEIVYQTDFSIEASSSRRKDIDQTLEVLDKEINTIVPLQLQSGDPNQMALAYDTLALQAKLTGMDPMIVKGRQNEAERFRELATAPPPLPAQVPPDEQGMPI